MPEKQEIDYQERTRIPVKKLLDTSIQYCDQCATNKEHDLLEDGDWEIYTCRSCGRNFPIRVR